MAIPMYEKVEQIAKLFRDGKADEAKALVDDSFKAHHFLKNIPVDCGVTPLLEFLNEKYQPDWSKYVSNFSYRDGSNINTFLEFAQNNNIDLLKTDKDGYTMYEQMVERIFGYGRNSYLINDFISKSSPELLQSETKKPLDKEHIIYKIMDCFKNNARKDDFEALSNIVEDFIEKGYDTEASKKKAWNNIVNKNNNFKVYLSSLPLNTVQTYLSKKTEVLSDEQTNQVYSHIVLSKCVFAKDLSKETFEFGMDLIKNNKFNLDKKNYYYPREHELLREVFNTYNKDENFSIKSKNQQLFLAIVNTQQIPLSFFNKPTSDRFSLFDNILTHGIECCRKTAYYSAQDKMKASGLEGVTPNEQILKEEFLNRIQDLISLTKKYLAVGIEPNLKEQNVEQLRTNFNAALSGERFYDEMPLGFMFRNFKSNNRLEIRENITQSNETETYNAMTLSIAKDLQLPATIVNMVLDSLEKHKKMEHIIPAYDESKEKKIIANFEELLNQAVDLNKLAEKEVKSKVKP
jgi:hypothetical protein